MAADKRELRTDFVSRDVNTTRTLREVGDAADKAADQIDELGDQSQQASEKVDDLGDDAAQTAVLLKALEAQAKQTKDSIRALAMEAAQSGDLAGGMKDINRQKRDLRRLDEIKNIIEDSGDDSAQGFFTRFAGRLSALMAATPMSNLVAPIAIGAAPAIASAVAGAVTLGIASGAVGAGIMIAAKDPEVAGAAKAVGAQIGDALGEDIGSAFKPEVRAALSYAQTEFRSLRPELRGLGRDAAEMVEPFTKGVVSGGKILVGSLRDAVADAEPLAELAGEHIPAMATALGGVIEDLASASESSADTLDSVLTFLEGSLMVTGEVLKGLAMVQQVFGGLGQIFGDVMGGGEAQETTTWADSLGSLAHKLDEAGGAAKKTKGEVRDLASQIAAMDETMRSVHDANISAAEATLAYKDSLLQAKEAADGSRKVSADEETALLSLAKASNDTTAALERQGASTAELAERTSSARKNFVAVAMQMGYTEQQAEELADSYLDVPGAVNTKANFNKQQAERDLATFNAKADHAARDRTMTIGVYWTSKGDLKVPGGTLTKSQGGMILGPGPKGVDSVPMIGAPGEFVVRASEVDKPGVLPFLEALNSGQWRPGGSTAAARSTSMPGTAATGPDLYALADLMERAFGRALAATPVVQMPNAGYQADLYQRGG